MAWAFRPYRVVGESMEPSLLAGDWLMLSHRTPVRDDLVIFHEPDSGKLGVKRVAGLPGERVQLLGGDLLIDGKVHARPLHSVTDLVPLLDDAGASAAKQMHFEGDVITTTADRWRLEGSGRAFLATPPDGGYLRRGVAIHAVEPASELGLEVDYALLDDSARLDLILRKGQSRFTARLADGGRSFAILLQEGAEGAEEILFQQDSMASVAAGTAFFTIADQGLTFVLDGEILLDHLAYPPTKPLRLVDLPAEFPQVEHAGLGGQGPLEIGRIRLGRDLLRHSGGTIATGVGLQLADGEYFLLGDHPSASRDSRHYGAVSDELIVGTVAARWWPREWTLRGWPRD